MAWFLALQGPAHITNQSSTYELQDTVDVDKMAQDLVDSAARGSGSSCSRCDAHPQSPTSHGVRSAGGLGRVDVLRTV